MHTPKSLVDSYYYFVVDLIHDEYELSPLFRTRDAMQAARDRAVARDRCLGCREYRLDIVGREVRVYDIGRTFERLHERFFLEDAG